MIEKHKQLPISGQIFIEKRPLVLKGIFSRKLFSTSYQCTQLVFQSFAIPRRLLLPSAETIAAVIQS